MMGVFYVIGPDGKPSEPVPIQVLLDWARAGQLPPNAPVIEGGTGRQLTAGEIPQLAALYQAGPVVAPVMNTDAGVLGGLVPFNNPDSLIAYYSSYFALFPILGLLIAPVVIIYARKAMAKYRENPAVKGKGHVITAYVLLTISLVINVPLLLLLIVGLTHQSPSASS